MSPKKKKKSSLVRSGCQSKHDFLSRASRETKGILRFPGRITMDFITTKKWGKQRQGFGSGQSDSNAISGTAREGLVGVGIVHGGLEPRWIKGFGVGPIPFISVEGPRRHQANGIFGKLQAIANDQRLFSNRTRGSQCCGRMFAIGFRKCSVQEWKLLFQHVRIPRKVVFPGKTCFRFFR